MRRYPAPYKRKNHVFIHVLIAEILIVTKTTYQMTVFLDSIDRQDAGSLMVITCKWNVLFTHDFHTCLLYHVHFSFYANLSVFPQYMQQPDVDNLTPVFLQFLQYLTFHFSREMSVLSRTTHFLCEIQRSQDNEYENNGPLGWDTK